MRKLLANGLAGIINPDVWKDNPFLSRDWHRDLRRNQPLIQILLMCIALLIGAFWLWRTLAYYSFLRGQYIGQRLGLPNVYRYFGGDIGSFAFIATSGVQVWFVTRAAQLRAAKVLSQEVARDRMTDLLMLPVDKQQTLIQAALYPWLHAMGVAATLLPVYLFCLFIGSVSWTDVVGIYVLFALLAMCVPAWRRPALNERIGLSPGGQTAAGAETEAVEVQKSASRGIRIGSASGVYLAILVPFIWLFLAYVNRGSTLSTLVAYVPDSVTSLLPGAIITWPLMAARLLFAPLDWFQYRIPPIPYVVLFVVLRQYLQLTRTSEFLSVGRYSDLCGLPSFRARRQLELLLNLFGVFMICGYLWKPLVLDGNLAGMFGMSMRSGSKELAFVFVSLFCAAWWTLIRAGSLGRWLGGWYGSPSVRIEVSFLSAAKFLALPMALGIALPVACSFIAHSVAWPNGATTLALSILGVTAAGALFGFGANRLLGYGAFVGFAIVPITTIGPRFERLFALSPTIGIMSTAARLLHIDFTTNSKYERPTAESMAFEAVLGVALYALATLKMRRRVEDTQAAEVTTPPLVIDPTIAGQDPLRDRTADKRLSNLRADSPLAAGAVAMFQRLWDNPVAVKEMRARLRSRLTPTVVIVGFAGMLGLSLLLGTYLRPVSSIGSGLAELLYGQATRPEWVTTLVNLQGCWYIAMLLSAILCGWNVLPRIFAVEVQKSTLTFLLGSPMRNEAIIFGKAIGAVLAGSLAVWALTIWTFLMSLLLVTVFDSAVPIIGFAKVMLTTMVLLITVAMVMVLLGTLFPRLGTVKVHGCIRIIIVYFLLQAIGLFSWTISWFLSSLDLSSKDTWTVFLSICIGTSVLCGFLSIAALAGKRRKDMDANPVKVKRR